jgi:hypothetical protein
VVEPCDPSSGQDCDATHDDYKCYKVKEPGRRSFERQFVTLDDQFGVDAGVQVITPSELCNPVDKNGEGISDSDGHLMCYKIRPGVRPAQRFVTDTDQFGDERLRVGGATELCVPAIKNGEGARSLEELERELNHFQCYRARGNPAIGPFQAELADQFETKVTDLVRTSLHCNPVSKDEGFVPDPSKHLKCYDIADAAGELPPFAGSTVTVEDQFGSLELLAGKATRLCEEACKNGECGTEPPAPGFED